MPDKSYKPEFCSRCGAPDPEFTVQLPIAYHEYPNALPTYSIEGFCRSCAAEIRVFALTPVDNPVRFRRK